LRLSLTPIIRILKTNVDQDTKVKAMEALSRMAKVESVTIQHCVINGDRTVTLKMDDAEIVKETA